MTTTPFPGYIGDRIALSTLRSLNPEYIAENGREFAVLAAPPNADGNGVLLLIQGEEALVIEQDAPNTDFRWLARDAEAVARYLEAATSDACVALRAAGFVPRLHPGMDTEWIRTDAEGGFDADDYVAILAPVEDTSGDPVARDWAIVRNLDEGFVWIEKVDLAEAIQHSASVPSPLNGMDFPDETLVTGIVGLQTLILQRMPTTSATMN